MERLWYKLLRRTGTEDEANNAISECRHSSTDDDERGDISDEDYHKILLANEIKRLVHAELGMKGVFSLSKTWDSPLMWSHYADEHRGMCIEYDTTAVDHPSIGAVDYRSPRSVKAGDLIEWKLRGSSEAERRVRETFFFAKSPQWRYEREWRDISDSSGVHNGSFLITAIYFGLRCDLAVITSIVKLLSAELDIKLYEIYPLYGSFRLSRRPVERGDIEAWTLRKPASIVFKHYLKDVVLPE